MFLPHACDSHDQVRFLAVEIHAVGVLQDHDAGAQYALLGIGGSVRNRKPHPQTGRRQLFAAQHCIDILRPGISARDEQFARPPDRLLLRLRRQSDPDISGLQDGAVRSGVLGGGCGFFGLRGRIGRGAPQTGLVARECGLCGPGTGYTARGRSFRKPGGGHVGRRCCFCRSERGCFGRGRRSGRSGVADVGRQYGFRKPGGGHIGVRFAAGYGFGACRRWFRFLQPDEQGVQTGIGEEVVDYDQLGAFCGRGDPLRQYGLTYDHIGIGRNTVRRTVAHRNADFRVP